MRLTDDEVLIILLALELAADAWNNNMMYKFDENGKPVEMKMVDWQVTRLGHPATDVVQFLFTSTSPETLRDHKQDLLNYYFDVLSSSMEKLGLEKYDRDLFLLEAKNRFRFGFFTALTFMAGILDDSAIKKSEELDAANEAKTTEFKPQEMIEEFKDFVDFKQILLRNSLLRQRAIDLTEDTKKALEPKYRRFQ